MNTKLCYVLSFAFLFLATTLFAQENIWSRTTFKEGTTGISLKNIDADNSKILQLNINDFKQQLVNAPLRSVSNRMSNTVISFPSVNGKMEQYRVVETAIFSSEDNEAQHPGIKTYLGSRTDGSGTRVRFSVTPLGLKAMISEPGKETVYIQPVTKVSNGQYIVYNRTAKLNSSDTFECLIEDVDISNKIIGSEVSRNANDQLLRTYRMAMSTAASYTNHWDDFNPGNGNAQADALAQLVSTLNRVNEVFEVDMAITFVLVDTADDPALDLIYSGEDPYDVDLNADLMANLTDLVGLADFDIGHLLVNGDIEGLAGCLGCVCDNTIDPDPDQYNNGKGSAYSSHTFLDNDGGPFMSDFFDIIVSHEIGHQMGANHTFSYEFEGNGVSSEPGSGTTIMSYAGGADANDIQDHQDPYFHYHSINQILINVNSGANQCAVTTAITNSPPVANAGINHTIPIGTAFILKGAATDADDGDILTYTWEQIDDGLTTNVQFGPTHGGPLWRSRPPNVSPNRYMPILSRVLVGQLTETNPVETADNTSWETVSTISRELNFALTVRDHSESGGVGQIPQTDFDTMKVTVDAAAGPFTVTSQTINVTWDAGSTETVTWDVAGTDGGAVNTPTVNILLSVDGGLTFPIALASNVPNNGSYDAAVPATIESTNTARVIVEGNNNIFYAVNSTNFTVRQPEFVVNVSNPEVDICQPADAVYNFTYNTFLGFSDITNFSVSGLPTGATAVINPTSATTDGTMGTVTVSGTGSLDLGTYSFSLVGTSDLLVESSPLTLNMPNDMLSPIISLVSPADGATSVSVDGMLTWDLEANTQDYLVEIAIDDGFTSITESTTVQTNTYSTTTDLAVNTQYFWRVTGSNECATATASSTFSFTTESLDSSCNSYTNSVSQVINAIGDADSVYSTVSVSSNFLITDVNVTIDITHTYDADLDISLTSPSGTIVVLSRYNGGAGDNYTGTIFDQESTNGSIAGNAAPFTGNFVPNGDLSSIYGEMSAGNWILTIDDDGFDDGGTFNSFTLELCQTTLSADEFNTSISEFSIYPNPNRGSFNVKLNSTSSENISVVVFDIRGRKVYNKRYDSSPTFNETINLESVQSGMYMLQVSDGFNTQTRKVIII